MLISFCHCVRLLCNLFTYPFFFSITLSKSHTDMFSPFPSVSRWSGGSLRPSRQSSQAEGPGRGSWLHPAFYLSSGPEFPLMIQVATALVPCKTVPSVLQIDTRRPEM